jgi:hypothetical protein
MLSLCLRSDSSPTYRPPFDLRAQVRLEALEDRVVPNAAPTISSFMILTHLPYRQVEVAGQVEDDGSVGGLAINFNGVAVGQTQTNSNGRFQTTLGCSALGKIHATAIDSQGLVSAPVSVTVTNGAARITDFSGSEGAGDLWTFSGKVIDEAPSGLAVTFTSGMPSLSWATATVLANGSFTFSVFLCDPNDYGTVKATVTDWWNAVSDPVYWVVEPSGLPSPFKPSGSLGATGLFPPPGPVMN